MLRYQDLDASIAAENHIRKTISRTKDLSASPVFSRYLGGTTIGVAAAESEDGMLVARNNVAARLYNSKPVKQVMVALVRNLRRALEILSGDDVHEGANEVKLANTEREDDRQQPESEGMSVSEGSFWADSEAELEEVHQSKTKATKAKIRKGERKLSSRPLNAASASYSDPDDNDVQVPSKRANGNGTALSDSESDLAVPSAKARPKKGKTLASKEDKNHTGHQTTSANSTFLPTLMAGGYWSGSESAEDIEQLRPRKNRRGQRARQAIWELKYGRNAKHLEKAPRGDDWDPRRGARDGNRVGIQQRRTGPGAATHNGTQSQRIATGSNAIVQTRSKPAGKPDPERPLHPSWEAARQAKAQKQATSFQGKKIVFD